MSLKLSDTLKVPDSGFMIRHSVQTRLRQEALDIPERLFVLLCEPTSVKCAVQDSH